MTRVDQLVSAVDEFLMATPDVEAAAVVSPDGFPIVCAVPDYVYEERLAAMSASLLALGERAVREVAKGDLKQLLVQGPHGHCLLAPAGRNAVLVVLTFSTARAGLVLYEMSRIAGRVDSIMQRPEAMEEPRQPPPVVIREGHVGRHALDLREAEVHNP